jgi:hypothetical protein
MQVAKEVKAWLSEWADRLGLAPDERITDYITHIFPVTSKNAEIPEEHARFANFTPVVAKQLHAE